MYGKGLVLEGRAQYTPDPRDYIVLSELFRVWIEEVLGSAVSFLANKVSCQVSAFSATNYYQTSLIALAYGLLAVSKPWLYNLQACFKEETGQACDSGTWLVVRKTAVSAISSPLMQASYVYSSLVSYNILVQVHTYAVRGYLPLPSSWTLGSTQACLTFQILQYQGALKSTLTTQASGTCSLLSDSAYLQDAHVPVMSYIPKDLSWGLSAVSGALGCLKDSIADFVERLMLGKELKADAKASSELFQEQGTCTHAVFKLLQDWVISSITGVPSHMTGLDLAYVCGALCPFRSLTRGLFVSYLTTFRASVLCMQAALEAFRDWNMSSVKAASMGIASLSLTSIKCACCLIQALPCSTLCLRITCSGLLARDTLSFLCRIPEYARPFTGYMRLWDDQEAQVTIQAPFPAYFPRVIPYVPVDGPRSEITLILPPKGVREARKSAYGKGLTFISGVSFNVEVEPPLVDTWALTKRFTTDWLVRGHGDVIMLPIWKATLALLKECDLCAKLTYKSKALALCYFILRRLLGLLSAESTTSQVLEALGDLEQTPAGGFRLHKATGPKYGKRLGLYTSEPFTLQARESLSLWRSKQGKAVVLGEPVGIGGGPLTIRFITKGRAGKDSHSAVYLSLGSKEEPGLYSPWIKVWPGPAKPIEVKLDPAASKQELYPWLWFELKAPVWQEEGVYSWEVVRELASPSADVWARFGARWAKDLIKANKKLIERLIISASKDQAMRSVALEVLLRLDEKDLLRLESAVDKLSRSWEVLS